MNTVLTYLADPVAEAIGLTILHSLWQGALIGILAWLFLKLRKNCSVQLSYLTAVLALAAILTSSILTFLSRYQPAAENHLQAGLLSGPHPSALTRAPGITEIAVKTGENTLPSFHQLLENALPWMTLVWMVGVLLLSLRLAGGLLFVHRLRSLGTSPLPVLWAERLEALVRRSGIKRRLEFRISSKAIVPMVIGFLRPVVLIPAGIISLMPVDQLESILAHEIAHIRRYDFLVNIFQSLLEALFFYHPAVWILSSFARQEREKCCDDDAVSLCGKLSVYARALAGLGEFRAGYALHSVAITGKRNKILNRVERLLNQRKMKNNAREKVVAGLLILSSAILLTFSTGASQSPLSGQLAAAFHFNLDAVASPESLSSPDALSSPEALNNPESLSSPEAVSSPDALNSPDALSLPEAVISPESSVDPLRTATAGNPGNRGNLSRKAILSLMTGTDTLVGHEFRDMDIKDNTVTRQFINKDGQELDMKFVVRKGEVVELYVNGEEIPESEYPEYQKEIDRTLRDLRVMDRELKEARQKMCEIDWEAMRAEIQAGMEHFRQQDMQKLQEEMQKLQQEHLDIQIDREKMQEELRKAMEESGIDQEKIREEMMKAREQAARAMQEIREGKYALTEEQCREIEKAMAEAMQEIELLDQEQMKEIFEKQLQALQEIDFEKIQKDIEKAMKEIETIDFEEIQRQIQESMKHLEMENLHFDKENKKLDEMIEELEKLELKEQ